MMSADDEQQKLAEAAHEQESDMSLKIFERIYLIISIRLNSANFP
jgi:hypothetical protein